MFSFLAKLKAETLVGLLIISGVGLVIYSAIRVTGLKDFKGEGNIIHAYFDDVAGLSPQTAVRIAGIKVGRIESYGNRAKESGYIQQIQTLLLVWDVTPKQKSACYTVRTSY